MDAVSVGTHRQRNVSAFKPKTCGNKFRGFFNVTYICIWRRCSEAAATSHIYRKVTMFVWGERQEYPGI